MRRVAVLLLASPLIALLPSCAAPEAHAVDGRPLHAPPLDPAVRTEREAAWARAKDAAERAPGDLDAQIWLGRRTAYLGRYREAIAIYTAALQAHPGEPHLLRHRGHRWITVRDFARAVDDLERAAAQVAGQPDEVEQDGLPNARRIPTGTLQFNIWYHLGLARYLRGDYEGAAAAYDACLAVSRNPDALCATTHWYYMTLRRLGRDAEAAALLEPIHAGLDVIENHGYHNLLLMYKGRRGPADLLKADRDAIQSATVAYGVANHHLRSNQPAAAIALLRKIVANPQWPAFGAIAAEVDLHRLGG